MKNYGADYPTPRGVGASEPIGEGIAYTSGHTSARRSTCAGVRVGRFPFAFRVYYRQSTSH